MTDIDAIATSRARERKEAERQELDRRRPNGQDLPRSFIGKDGATWYGPLFLAEKESPERAGEACGLEVVAHGPPAAMHGLMAANGVVPR